VRLSVGAGHPQKEISHAGAAAGVGADGAGLGAGAGDGTGPGGAGVGVGEGDGALAAAGAACLAAAACRAAAQRRTTRRPTARLRAARRSAACRSAARRARPDGRSCFGARPWPRAWPRLRPRADETTPSVIANLWSEPPGLIVNAIVLCNTIYENGRGVGSRWYPDTLADRRCAASTPGPRRRRLLAQTCGDPLIVRVPASAPGGGAQDGGQLRPAAAPGRACTGFGLVARRAALRRPERP